MKVYHYQKPRPKSKKLKILVFIFSIILAGGLILEIFSDETSESTTNLSSESAEIVQQKTPPPYDFSTLAFPSEGQSAVGTLGYGVVATNIENEVVSPMASITKLITVLAILEKAPLNTGEQGDTITLTSQDEQYWHDYVALQGTITPVTAGYQMTQYEALQAILLPSSNNISDTLVDRYFTNREEYLAFANSLIQSYGLKNTKVADASGFSPESVSTPSDLIVIGQKVLQNPVLAEIVAQPTAEISVAGTIPNYNPLIEVPGVTGIKPGATDEAGYCLIFSANTTNKQSEPETIIAVVMGIDNRATYINGALKLLEDTKKIISEN